MWLCGLERSMFEYYSAYGKNNFIESLAMVLKDPKVNGIEGCNFIEIQSMASYSMKKVFYKHYIQT